mmetsp:Transcript_50195/g.94019  ORF Transcript_50195/g.94019 Transcript_50195/m.94019 type:complete len:725 (-) Transcript_50195:36-2210(-)
MAGYPENLTAKLNEKFADVYGDEAEAIDEATASLLAAARQGNTGGVQDALNAGANLLAKDRWGLTALHSAAIYGSPESISVLLEHRANIDELNMRGQSALHLAAAEGKDDAIVTLMELRADVARPTAYGSSALELAMRRAQGGKGLALIQEEVVRRWELLDEEEKDLQAKLAWAREKRGLLEAQVRTFRPPPEKPPTPPPPPPGEPIGTAIERASQYWRTAAKAIATARERGEEAMLRACLREAPSGNTDPFPWTGKHISKNAFPLPDPDDAELVKGYEWLQTVAEHEQHIQSRPGYIPREKEYDEAQRIEDEAMVERTGKTQDMWTTFVREIHARGGSWDWKNVKVQQYSERYRGADCPEARLDKAGAFVQGMPGTVVFKSGDVIGPLPGLVRRRKRYQELHYPERVWALHDPLGYEYMLRVQTTDLKLEPLVLDLVAGQSPNRLRYVADVRADPLCLSNLLAPVPSVTPRSVLPPRSRMARPRSRPGTPEERFKRGAKQGSAGDSRPPPTPQVMQAVHDHHNGASALLAEVLVDGWPYVFVVAARDLLGSEEITVDFGQAHWSSQRAMLTRMLDIGKFGHEMVAKVDGAAAKEYETETSKVDYKEELPPRKPMRRAGEKEPAPGTFLDAGDPEDRAWLGIPASPLRTPKTWPAPVFPDDVVEEEAPASAPPDVLILDEAAAAADGEAPAEEGAPQKVRGDGEEAPEAEEEEVSEDFSPEEDG